MVEIRGIVTSVDYGGLLRRNLWRNMRHLRECVVVTSHEDEETQRVAREVPGVRLHVTDAFTRHGGYFNKGLAMEEGLDVLGRRGWILIWDADITFPARLPYGEIRPGCLHGCPRRCLTDPVDYRDSLDWRTLPIARDGNRPIGYFQLFHAASPWLQNQPWWYDPRYLHAGGADEWFQRLPADSQKVMLSCEVLHTGPIDTNWFGTSPERRQLQTRFLTRRGWNGHRPEIVYDPAAEPVRERSEIPGYPNDLPFVV